MKTSFLTGLLSQQPLNAARVVSRTHGRHVVIHARGYAAPAKPTGTTGVSNLDVDLWKSYNTGLRNFVFSGNKLNPKTQAFFTAPVGTMGIPAGQNIPQPITNSGLFQVADSLLDINSPVFTPGNAGSYIDRQSRYINSIQLKKNTNAGAWMRLQSAEKKQADLANKMDGLRPKAQAAFEADTDKPEKMPFRTWVSKNYPHFDSLTSELQQAASARGAAMIEVYGPGAQELFRKQSLVSKAQNADELNPGTNMRVSDQEADVINGTTLDENAIPQYKPLYTIDKGYSDAVKQWVANSASDSGSAKPVTISINTSKSSTESWEDSGFSKTSASVGARYWFISARTTVNNVEKEEHLSLEQLGSGISVNLRATGIKAFDVKPGGWDGDFGNLFKDVSLLANFSLPPACAVSQVVMGYNVSLDISMNSAAAKQVSDLYSRTTSAGGSLSILGIPIGARGEHENSKSTAYNVKNNQNSFSSFSIAGEDGGYPVVLGVVGRKLQALGKPN